jgi:hypothetical protein
MAVTLKSITCIDPLLAPTKHISCTMLHVRLSNGDDNEIFKICLLARTSYSITVRSIEQVNTLGDDPPKRYRSFTAKACGLQDLEGLG